jgi:hypothetical protein
MVKRRKCTWGHMTDLSPFRYFPIGHLKFYHSSMKTNMYALSSVTRSPPYERERGKDLVNIGPLFP